MDRSGRDLLDLDPAFRDNLKRFDLPWNPWPGKPLLSPLVAKALPGSAAQAEKLLQKLAPKPLVGGMNPFIAKGTLRGRRYILIDDWGPYDFKHPLLWPRESVRDPQTGITERTYEVMGPKGNWKLITDPVGVTLSSKSGSVPGFLKVKLPAKGSIDLNLVLEYVGAATTDIKGNVTPADTPIRFGIHDFQTSIDWTMSYYGFDPSVENPLENEGDFAKITKRPPLFEEQTSSLNWSGRPSVKVPSQYFASVGEGSFTIPAGEYVIEITSDDGVRAWLDDKPIVTTGWLHQSPTTYRAKLNEPGPHRLRVEHFQQDGYATLRVAIVPAPVK
jgi:hypothetical protein